VNRPHQHALTGQIGLRPTPYVALRLRWPPQLTDALLIQAEQIAIERGWKPPLATLTAWSGADQRTRWVR